MFIDKKGELLKLIYGYVNKYPKAVLSELCDSMDIVYDTTSNEDIVAHSLKFIVRSNFGNIVVEKSVGNNFIFEVDPKDVGMSIGATLNDCMLMCAKELLVENIFKDNTVESIGANTLPPSPVGLIKNPENNKYEALFQVFFNTSSNLKLHESKQFLTHKILHIKKQDFNSLSFSVLNALGGSIRR